MPRAKKSAKVNRKKNAKTNSKANYKTNDKAIDKTELAASDKKDSSTETDSPQEPRVEQREEKRDFLVSEHEVDVKEVYDLEEKIEAEDAIKSRKMFRAILLVLLLLTIATAAYILSTDRVIPDTGTKNPQNQTTTDQQIEPGKTYGQYTEAELTSFVEEFMDVRVSPPVGAPSKLNASNFLSLPDGETLDDANLAMIEKYDYEIVEFLEPTASDSIVRVIVQATSAWETVLEMLTIVETDVDSKFSKIGQLRLSSEITKPILNISVDDADKTNYVVSSIIKRRVINEDGLTNYAAIAYPYIEAQGVGSCGFYDNTDCVLLYSSNQAIEDGSWTLFKNNLLDSAGDTLVLGELEYFIVERDELVFRNIFGDAGFYAEEAYKANLENETSDYLYGLSNETPLGFGLDNNSYSAGDFNRSLNYENNDSLVVSSDFEQTCERGIANNIESTTILRNPDKANELYFVVNICTYNDSTSEGQFTELTNIYTEIYDKSGELVYTYEIRSDAIRPVSIDSTQNLLVGSEEIIFDLFGDVHIARRVGNSVTVEEL